jgi:hypothetical protein
VPKGRVSVKAEDSWQWARLQSHPPAVAAWAAWWEPESTKCPPIEWDGSARLGACRATCIGSAIEAPRFRELK